MKTSIQRTALALFAAGALSITGLPAQAAGLTYGVGVQAGTLGVGPDVHIGVNSYLGFDLGLNRYTYTFTGTQSNIDYNFAARLHSVHLLANVYPFGGVFHLTAGLVSNNNKFDLSATPSATGYTINNTVYTPTEVGSLDGKMTFPGTAYYVGLGWGLSFDPGSHWGFNADLGGLYQGTPHVALTSSGGTSSTNPTFQTNLATQQTSTQASVNNWRWWPVVRLGLYYTF